MQMQDTKFYQFQVYFKPGYRTIKEEGLAPHRQLRGRQEDFHLHGLRGNRGDIRPHHLGRNSIGLLKVLWKMCLNFVPFLEIFFKKYFLEVKELKRIFKKIFNIPIELRPSTASAAACTASAMRKKSARREILHTTSL